MATPLTLRPYQQEAVDAACAWMRRCIEPACLELATGAGKSLIVASIAEWIYTNTGKRVLCLQPSKELTEQNWEKFQATGHKASIFSASAGSKCLRYPVVYATPGTVKNSMSRFGEDFACVIIDECHGLTPSIKFILSQMRTKNKNLRIIGMTATPFRLGTGYVYQYDVDGSFVPEDESRDPFFNTLLYRITTPELIEQGYLTPVHADPREDSYSAKGLQLNSRGQFDARDVERVFEGKGRLTSQIIADVVAHSHGRRGVMIFAATVQHAKECMGSLPPELSRMLGGDVNMTKTAREKLVRDFKAQRFKYVVSVGTLTTGFDAPHVDVIAILRATESPGLLQQIIGRGLRLYDGKEDCLLLDYAENVERHQLEGNLFKPRIRVKGTGEGSGTIEAECPACSFVNEFSARPNPEEFKASKDGYFLDLAGNPVTTEDGPIPAHFGRRCTGQIIQPGGVYVRCDHRWTSKECPECKADNDIAARYCARCKAEIIDPNEKLRQEFHRLKRDEYEVSTDKVLAFTAHKTITRAGNESLLCQYTTEYRTFPIWYNPNSNSTKAQRDWHSLNSAIFSGHIAPDIDTFLQYLPRGKAPTTITGAFQRNTDFYRLIAHNRPEDEIPS